MIGAVPTPEAVNADGLVPAENLETILKVDPAEWVEAVAAQDDFFRQFGDRLPPEMRQEHERLATRRRAGDHAAGHEAGARVIRTDSGFTGAPGSSRASMGLEPGSVSRSGPVTPDP